MNSIFTWNCTFLTFIFKSYQPQVLQNTKRSGILKPCPPLSPTPRHSVPLPEASVMTVLLFLLTDAVHFQIFTHIPFPSPPVVSSLALFTWQCVLEVIPYQDTCIFLILFNSWKVFHAMVGPVILKHKDTLGKKPHSFFSRLLFNLRTVGLLLIEL